MATKYPVVRGGTLEIDGDDTGTVVISPPPVSVVSDAKVNGNAIYKSITFVATTSDGYVTPPTVLAGNSIDVKADTLPVVLDDASITVTATQPPPSGATKSITVQVSDAGQTDVMAS